MRMFSKRGMVSPELVKHFWARDICIGEIQIFSKLLSYRFSLNNLICIQTDRRTAIAVRRSIFVINILHYIFNITF